VEFDASYWLNKAIMKKPEHSVTSGTEKPWVEKEKEH